MLLLKKVALSYACITLKARGYSLINLNACGYSLIIEKIEKKIYIHFKIIREKISNKYFLC